MRPAEASPSIQPIRLAMVPETSAPMMKPSIRGHEHQRVAAFAFGCGAFVERPDHGRHRRSLQTEPRDVGDEGAVEHHRPPTVGGDHGGVQGLGAAHAHVPGDVPYGDLR